MVSDHAEVSGQRVSICENFPRRFMTYVEVPFLPFVCSYILADRVRVNVNRAAVKNKNLPHLKGVIIAVGVLQKITPLISEIKF
jgi:hypothetical protein